MNIRAALKTLVPVTAVAPMLLLASPGNAGATVSRPAAISQPAQRPAITQVSATLTYQVHSGDTLSRIAQREYGHSDRWPALWWANRHRIHNPDVLRVGQILRLGSWHPRRAWLTSAARRAMGTVRRKAVKATFVSYQATGTSAFERCVISHESGGNPRAVNASSGAGGLFQFLPSTWASLGMGYPGGAQTAPYSVQVAAFWKLFRMAGTSPWAPYDGC